jgi:hypothetical protein
MKDNRIETLEKIISETARNIRDGWDNYYSYDDEAEHLNYMDCSEEEWDELYSADYYEARNAADYEYSWIEQYESELEEYQEEYKALTGKEYPVVLRNEQFYLLLP